MDKNMYKLENIKNLKRRILKFWKTYKNRNTRATFVLTDFYILRNIIRKIPTSVLFSCMVSYELEFKR